MRYAKLIILENGNTRDFISVAGVPVTSRESEPAKSSTSQKCLEPGCGVWHILSSDAELAMLKCTVGTKQAFSQSEDEAVNANKTKLQCLAISKGLLLGCILETIEDHKV